MIMEDQRAVIRCDMCCEQLSNRHIIIIGNGLFHQIPSQRMQGVLIEPLGSIRFPIQILRLPKITEDSDQLMGNSGLARGVQADTPVISPILGFQHGPILSHR